MRKHHSKRPGSGKNNWVCDVRYKAPGYLGDDKITFLAPEEAAHCFALLAPKGKQSQIMIEFFEWWRRDELKDWENRLSAAAERDGKNYLRPLIHYDCEMQRLAAARMECAILNKQIAALRVIERRNLLRKLNGHQNS